MEEAFSIQTVRRRKVHEDVADALGKLIRSGAIGEGEVLPSERDLMVRFRVGRPAIREALLSLERNGLVALNNGARARATRPSTSAILKELSSAARFMLSDPEGMRNFQSARRLIEIAVVRHAAQHAKRADIVILRMALERNIAARGNAVEFEETDVAFHYAICRIVGNPLVIGLHEALTSWLREQRTVSLKWRGAERLAIDFHMRIFDAIVAHDADAAEAAMEAHLTKVAEMYWRVADTKAQRQDMP